MASSPASVSPELSTLALQPFPRGASAPRTRQDRHAILAQAIESNQLVGLQTEPPLGVCQAILRGRARVVFSRCGPSMGWRKNSSNGRLAKRSGSAPGCGYINFSSLPVLNLSSASAFGLTHVQSTPGGASNVPLVSMPISKPRAQSERRPLRRVATVAHHPCRPHKVLISIFRAISRRRHSRVLPETGIFPPPFRWSRQSRCRKSDISRWSDRARGRSHRLQPAKRRNAAGRPVRAPSP